MRRRDLLALPAAMVALRSLAALAQQPNVRPVGFLHSASPVTAADLVAAFRHGLGEEGFTEGRNAAIAYAWAESKYDRLPALAVDLVRRGVEVLATGGGDLSAAAAKNATATIPIVSVIGGDPVASHLVASLARPGGNLTGVSFLTASLTLKRFELLGELVPRAKIFGLLVNPHNPQTPGVVSDLTQAAAARGFQLHTVECGGEPEIERAFETLNRFHPDALVVEADPLFSVHGPPVVALAARYRLPAIYERSELVRAGGLISYGTSLTGVYRQVGIYAGKILKGAKAAELPVVQPTAFTLAINLKTAKALGLAVPRLLLAGADEVIQ